MSVAEKISPPVLGGLRFIGRFPDANVLTATKQRGGRKIRRTDRWESADCRPDVRDRTVGVALPVVLAGPIVRRVAGDRSRCGSRCASRPRSSSSCGPDRSGPPDRARSRARPGVPGDGADQALRRPAPRRRRRGQGRGTVIAPGAIHSYDVVVGGQSLLTLGCSRTRGRQPAAGRRRRRPRCTSPSATSSIGCRASSPRPRRSATSCLAQGSCRRTNAAGPDAMAYLDDLIADHRLDLTRRPQQLFLTGDQIYADDLAGCLLPQINAIGRELLGFTETLPIDNRAVPVTIEEFPVQRRRKVVREIGRFSTTDGLHHLLSYGELLAMHLLVWSPSLWRPLTTADEVFVPSDEGRGEPPSDWETFHEPQPGDPDPDGLTKWERTGRAWLHRGAQASRDLPGRRPAGRSGAGQHGHVHDLRRPRGHRRLVPVADLARRGCSPRRSAGPSSATATPPMRCARPGATTRRRSPTPAQNPKPKNEELLDTLVVGRDRRRVQHDDRSSKLEQLLGLTQPVIDPEVRVRLHGPRTPPPRARPRHPLPAHLSGPARATEAARRNSLDTQLPPGPLTDGRELLVVVSPVPILMPHAIDTLVQPLAAGIIDFKSQRQAQGRGRSRRPADQPAPSASTSRAGAATRSRSTPSCAGSPPTQRCVILSGDVHFSSSIALDFWSGAGPDGRLADRAAHVVAGAQQRRRRTSAPRSAPPASPSSCCAACPSNGSAGPRSRRSPSRRAGDLAGPPQPDEGRVRRSCRPAVGRRAPRSPPTSRRTSASA